jgi:hypothetical protein
MARQIQDYEAVAIILLLLQVCEPNVTTSVTCDAHSVIFIVQRWNRDHSSILYALNLLVFHADIQEWVDK